VYDELDAGTKDFVDRALIALHDDESHLLSVDLNVCYFIQALALRKNLRKEEILIEVFDKTSNPIVRRLIILAMADWGCHYWLSDIKTRYATLSEWERRAFILASYVLGDEGEHWRSHAKSSWTPGERVIRDWFADRYQKNKVMPL
jgi:hypothetical protein